MIVDDGGRHEVAGSWIKRSGTNYLAELAGILAGLIACPAQAEVCVLGLPRSNPGDKSPGAVYAISQTAEAGARRLLCL